jgi:dihydroneopterin aldolase
MIWLRGISCSVKLGVPASERRRRQKVLIDVGLKTDIRKAAAGDDFRLTADYWAVEKAVRAMAESGQRRLVETLAEQAAALVLSGQKGVRSVRVIVRKRPVVMPRTGEVAVEIFRRRSRL